jgi:phage replication O-like protein O
MSTIKEPFTPIPNDILEAACKANLSGREYQAFLVIVRRTCGWHEPTAEIPYKVFNEYMNLEGRSRAYLTQIIKHLEDIGLVKASHQHGKKTIYSLTIPNIQTSSIERTSTANSNRTSSKDRNSTSSIEQTSGDGIHVYKEKERKPKDIPTPETVETSEPKKGGVIEAQFLAKYFKAEMGKHLNQTIGHWTEEVAATNLFRDLLPDLGEETMKQLITFNFSREKPQTNVRWFCSGIYDIKSEMEKSKPKPIPSTFFDTQTEMDYSKDQYLNDIPNDLLPGYKEGGERIGINDDAA